MSSNKLDPSICNFELQVRLNRTPVGQKLQRRIGSQAHCCFYGLRNAARDHPTLPAKHCELTAESTPARITPTANSLPLICLEVLTSSLWHTPRTHVHTHNLHFGLASLFSVPCCHNVFATIEFDLLLTLFFYLFIPSSLAHDV